MTGDPESGTSRGLDNSTASDPLLVCSEDKVIDPEILE